MSLPKLQKTGPGTCPMHGVRYVRAMYDPNYQRWLWGCPVADCPYNAQMREQKKMILAGRRGPIS